MAKSNQPVGELWKTEPDDHDSQAVLDYLTRVAPLEMAERLVLGGGTRLASWTRSGKPG